MCAGRDPRITFSLPPQKESNTGNKNLQIYTVSKSYREFEESLKRSMSCILMASKCLLFSILIPLIQLRIFQRQNRFLLVNADLFLFVWG